MEHISQVSIQEHKQMTCQYSTELSQANSWFRRFKNTNISKKTVVSEMLVFNYLSAREDIIEYCHHENLKT